MFIFQRVVCREAKETMPGVRDQTAKIAALIKVPIRRRKKNVRSNI